jgi:hypothetical protein
MRDLQEIHMDEIFKAQAQHNADLMAAQEKYNEALVAGREKYNEALVASRDKFHAGMSERIAVWRGNSPAAANKIIDDGFKGEARTDEKEQVTKPDIEPKSQLDPEPTRDAGSVTHAGDLDQFKVAAE